MAMIIRVFRTADNSDVKRLWERCGLTVPWNDPQRDINRKMKVLPELFLVGELDGAVVASAMGGYDGHRGWVYYLGVDPDYRRRGLGREMLAALEQRLQDLGCPKLNLMVRDTNREMLDFYRHVGYSVDEVVCLGKRLINDGG